MSYTTAADIAAYGNLGTPDAALTTLLTSIAAEVTQAINALCDRTFAADSDTAQAYYLDETDYDEHGRPRLWLGQDLAALTSIVNSNNEDVTANARLVPSRTKPAHSLLLTNNATWGDNEDIAIVVTGRWAYSLTPPADVKRAAELWALHLYRLSDLKVNVTVNVAGVAIRQGNRPDEVTRLLQQYMRLR